MKTTFALFVFIVAQTLGLCAQEVSAPPRPLPSCDAPKYNPAIGFLTAPDAGTDENLSTSSIAAAPLIPNVVSVLPNPQLSLVSKAKHKLKKHKKRGKI